MIVIPPSGLLTHTAEHGAAAPAVTWLEAALAAATPGRTAFIMRAGVDAQDSAQRLRTALLDGGCTCSADTPDLMVFDFIGCVSEHPAVPLMPTLLCWQSLHCCADMLAALAGTHLCWSALPSTRH